MPYKDPDKYRESCRKGAANYRKKNPEKVRANNARRTRDEWFNFDRYLWRKYKIHEKDYWNMFASQWGLCWICQLPERVKHQGRVKRLTVDHCHDTGKVRGLLCATCNSGLGHLQDDIKLLRRSVSYLERTI